MANKTIYFEKLFGYSVTAITENGVLTDCRFAEEKGAPAIGNIYKGIVVNVLNGMQAAFIDCGLERNCYLSAEDLPRDGAGGLETLSPGDEIMVQIVKTPEGKKGAKVSTRISLVGKTLIYLPTTDFLGLSRRIEDEELRQNLLAAATRVKRPHEGIVVRNFAPFVNYKHIREELAFLREIYRRAQENYNAATAPALIHTDFTMPVRVMREYLKDDVARIVTSDRQQYEEIADLLKILPEGNTVALEFYDRPRDMLEERGVAEQIFQACQRRVDLEGGAYLIIERTEALTSIDVNTGSFTGEDSLEDTVYRTNLRAAREIARQVKLRNAGGLFVVDFIDMQQPEHRKALADELEHELKKDGAPYRVLPMSEFGLIEFTRKRSGAELTSFALKPCPVCGTGNSYTDNFAIMEAYAQMLRLLEGGAARVCAELAPEAIKLACSMPDFASDIAEKYPSAEVWLIPSYKAGPRGCVCRDMQGEAPSKKAKRLL